MKKYNSTVNPILVPLLVLVVVGIVSSFFFVDKEIGEEMPLPIKIFLGLVALILSWILLDTNYVIKENHLYYRSGPIRGKIDVLKITKVENVKTWYVSSILKPALGSYGLTVIYNKFDDIYISPKHKEEFINELLKINPDIQIIP